jgi:hypothetical protein
MNSAALENNVLPRWMQSWERFWFTAMDPTPLAFIRILSGLVITYTFLAYSFCLAEMMGPDAWVDLQTRQSQLTDRPIFVGPLKGGSAMIPARNAEQRAYLDKFRQECNGVELRALGLPPPENLAQLQYAIQYFHDAPEGMLKVPPPAYAASQAEAIRLEKFRFQYRLDPRVNGLRAPQTEEEWAYLARYVERWKQPPPAYAETEAEEQFVNDYREREGLDPRICYSRGTPAWSLFMHVTDPRWMAWVHGAFLLVTVMFTLGLGTRVTAALTWFASLNYIHRNVQIMFGADTMINILLLYLMIGPSGAALSLDRLILRWWRGADRPLPPPAPRVSANVAIRLLQIHVCIIYLMAGLAKLQGAAWWNGNALWGVLGNYEFAPMQFALYNDLMRFICRNSLLLDILCVGGCYFTLFFEIGYAFLIWLPRTRWLYLGAAILLHGGIGMFMGLKTFAMLMLVLNMSFLRPEEVHWLLSWFRTPLSPRPLAVPAREPVGSVATAVKR